MSLSLFFLIVAVIVTTATTSPLGVYIESTASTNLNDWSRSGSADDFTLLDNMIGLNFNSTPPSALSTIEVLPDTFSTTQRNNGSTFAEPLPRKIRLGSTILKRQKRGKLMDKFHDVSEWIMSYLPQEPDSTEHRFKEVDKTND